MLKRLFDIYFSFIGLIVLMPILIFLALAVGLTSKGGIFYKQIRVGRNGKDFGLFKFRSMAVGSDKKGLLTVGVKDNRITRVGYYLRKYKLDELPQLINVFIGDMSLVGPRPEVRKYVDLYSEDDLRILSVRPGITDYASLEYFNENAILGAASDPEKAYIEEVMPAKLALNKKYINEAGVVTDVKIILKTIGKIFQ